MVQNTSSAVMQQRSEAKDSLEDFPTPPWATRALIAAMSRIYGYDPAKMDVAEPACNRGFMVMPLEESFRTVIASDVYDYGSGYPTHDYLLDAKPNQVEATFTNPPFRLAEEFIQQGLRASRVYTAMLVRAAFTEGVGRYNRLFRSQPPSDIFQFAERVIMHKGFLRDPEKHYWNPEKKNKDGTEGAWVKPSTATSYCWIVWRAHAQPGTKYHWIAPCRREFTRPGDYPINPDERGQT